MLFKLGLKNLKHNLLMNILTVLQMTVAFVILISMISTIVSRFEYYTPLKELLNSRGNYYNVTYGVNPETKQTIRTSEELSELVQGEEKIISQFSVWLEYKDSNNNSLGGRFVSYDEEFINMLHPEMESGYWLNPNKTDEIIVQVVVSQNEYGIKTGDIITLSFIDTEIKAKVIGVLMDDTKILLPSLNDTNTIDYRNLYTNYKLEREGQPIFIFSQNDLIDQMVNMQIDGNLFIKYLPDTPDEVIDDTDKAIRRLHTLQTSTIKDLKRNSLEYIFSQIYNLIPIFICVLILTLVGAISTSALSAKVQLRNYAVFNICGLEWRKCAIINFWSSFICAMTSFITSVFAIVILKTLGILGETVIEIGIWELLGCLAIIIIYVALSIILPINIIGSNTPNQVLKAN